MPINSLNPDTNVRMSISRLMIILISVVSITITITIMYQDVSRRLTAIERILGIPS